MRSRNRVELIGNLGSDPEAIVFDNGTMKVSISVATSEVYKNRDTGETVENTEWHKCVAYGKLAEIINQYLRKGSKVLIEGKLKYGSFDDKNGVKRYTTDIVINEFMFLDTKGDSNGSQPLESQPVNVQEDDDDLPF